MATSSIVYADGGCPRSLAKHHRSLATDMVIASDVPGELAAAGLREGDGLVLNPLGVGHTLATLCDRIIELAAGRPELAWLNEPARLARDLPVDLDHGAGQVRLVGFLLACLFELEGGEKLLEKKVFEPLFIKAAGSVTGIHGTLVTSTPGGAGGGMTEVLSRLHAKLFTARVDVPISTTWICVVPESYLGVGDHIWHNGAPALEEAEKYICGARDPRELRNILLVSLPMDVRDAAKRDAHAWQILAPLVSGEARDIFDAVRVNTPLDKYGQFRFAQPRVFGDLPRQAVIRAVATKFRDDLEGVATTKVAPNPICREITYRTLPEGRPLPSLEEIERLLRDHPTAPPESLREKVEAIPQVRLSVTIRIYSGDVVGADQILHSTPLPNSVSEYAASVATRLGVQEFLDRELKTVKKGLRRKQRAAASALHQVRRSQAALYPQGTRDQFTAHFSKREDRLQRLLAAIPRNREAGRALAEDEAKVAALDGILTRLAQQSRISSLRLQAALDMLEAVQAQTLAFSGAQKAFSPCPLDISFRALLLAAESGDMEEMMSLLARSVQMATPEGVLASLGLPAPAAIDERSVARTVTGALVKGEGNCVECPPLGFQPRPDPPEQDVLVLPPVSVGFRAAIEEELRSRGSQARVTVRPDVEEGLCIVEYRVFRLPNGLLAKIAHKYLDEVKSNGHAAFHVLPPHLAGLAAVGGGAGANGH